MNADRWIVFLALGFICVSSNEEPDSCDPYLDVCETSPLSAALGSSVLLPCIFETSNLSQVSWARTTGLDLVQLTSEGHIKFLDHKYGRVKVFPNQGSEGNYSIRIDELKHSDLGCYRCKQGPDCLQVELAADRGASSETSTLPVYICVAVAAVTLLSVGGYCCVKCILWCNNRTIYIINNPEGADTEGATAAPQEAGRVPVDQQQGGGGNINLVYENDDQDPFSLQDDLRRNYCNPVDLPDPGSTQPTPSMIYPNLSQFETVESQKTKQRIHKELFSRLRQASLNRHHYANQGEISSQQAVSTPAENHHRAGFGKKKKAKKSVELKNPIYNHGTDRLNL